MLARPHLDEERIRFRLLEEITEMIGLYAHGTLAFHDIRNR